MWIARDEDGDLLIFEEKPTKRNGLWVAGGNFELFDNQDLFPEIKKGEAKELIIKD